MLAQTDEQIVDLLRNGQGVLNIVLARAGRQQTSITEAAQRRARPTRHAGDVAAAASRRGRGARHRQSRALPHELVRFAHNSERQFAKLLDFYGIAWDYEPRTFTLECDRDGQPAQAFTPDFYLPAYDLYIEITTLNQKLVTKKNRKARRLRELHPDVQIRVLYQRDYLHLLVKYGLEPPSQLADAERDAERREPPLPLDLGRAPRRSRPAAAAESA